VFRDEVQQLVRESEQLEDSLKTTRRDLQSEHSHKLQLERLLSEAASALRAALRVCDSLIG
jgi:hypothetical protein